MPCTPQAVDVLKKAKVLVAPAKAASAGGVCSSHFISFFFSVSDYMLDADSIDCKLNDFFSLEIMLFPLNSITN